MNRKWIVSIVAALAVTSSSAMAGKSPAQSCARVFDTLVLNLFSGIGKAALSVCSGKTTLDEVGTKLTDTLNTKTLPKASAAIKKAGTCDPDLGLTAGSLDVTVSVANVTSSIQNGSTIAGVEECNGVDDP